MENTQVPFDVNELLGSLNETINIVNTGAVQYQHPAGKYNVIIGELVVYYKDANGKTKNEDGTKVEKTQPGATPAFANLVLYNMAEAGTTIISIGANKEITCAPVDYGRYTHRLFINFDSDKQYQNKNLFADFDAPGLEVVANPKSKDFSVRPSYLPVYQGIPAVLTLKEYTSKAGKQSVIVDSLKLQDKTFSKALVDERRTMAFKIKAAVELLKPKKEEGNETVPVASADASDILKDLTNPPF